MRGSIVCMALGGLAFSGQAAANGAIKNGGFEKPPAGESGLTEVAVGKHIAGWLVVGPQSGNILLLSKTYTEEGGELHFNPHSGKQAVDLTGSYNQGAVGLLQNVKTTTGQSYTVTFWLGNQYDGAQNYGSPSSVMLYVNNTAVNTFTTDMNTVDKVTWQKFSYQFTASSSETSISFVNATPAADYYCGLDDISLATP